MGFVILAVIVCGCVFLFTQRKRERAMNAPLRSEIEAQVRFETPLARVSTLGTGGFGATRGVWISLRGPKRLTVGTDSFMISAPQALREYVFIGRESSIAFSQLVASRYADGDWIVITGQPGGGRQIQFAIRHDNLPAIWQTLSATGASLV